jgi:Polyketide cyclase / dehydrase and lipid transport
VFTTSCSTVIDHRLAATWAMVRDFNNYPVYIEGVTESIIEDDRPGDEVGAVRRFCYGGMWLRQRLQAHSDEQCSLTYVGLSPFEFPEDASDGRPPPAAYEGTIRLVAVDGDRTRVEWSVSVDAMPTHAGRWRDVLLKMIPEWTNSLERTLRRRE